MGFDNRTQGTRQMREFITAYDVANEVRMKRTQHAGTFLIVEGGDDGRLYGNFVDHKNCRIIIAQGRDNAIQALSILEKDSFAGVLALVDADFWIVEKTSLPSPNLIITDTHDLETMIIKSPALDKIVSEFGHAGKLEKLNRNVRSILLEKCVVIGCLRLINARSNLTLDFKNLSFNKFIDSSTLNVNVSELIRILKARSLSPALSESMLRQQIRDIENENYDPWQICCGHDLVSLLSIGLSKLFGSTNARDIQVEPLEKSLRLAYESAYFVTTGVYKKLIKWETSNPPFKILSKSI